MTSLWRHRYVKFGVYPTVINLVLMFYLASKFQDNSINTFGFIEGGEGFWSPPPPPPIPQSQELRKSPGGRGLKCYVFSQNIIVYFSQIFNVPTTI